MHFLSHLLKYILLNKHRCSNLQLIQVQIKKDLYKLFWKLTHSCYFLRRFSQLQALGIESKFSLSTVLHKVGFNWWYFVFN